MAILVTKYRKVNAKEKYHHMSDESQVTLEWSGRECYSRGIGLQVQAFGNGLQVQAPVLFICSGFCVTHDARACVASGPT